MGDAIEELIGALLRLITGAVNWRLIRSLGELHLDPDFLWNAYNCSSAGYIMARRSLADWMNTTNYRFPGSTSMKQRRRSIMI